MNFLLSEQQAEIQRTVARLLADRCNSTTLHQIVDSESDFDGSAWSQLSAMGVAGLHLPEAYGGAGLEMLDLALVAEVLGGAAAPGPWLSHWLAALAILEAGDERQRATWLPKLASGEVVGAVAFAEGRNCWQPGDWNLVAGERLSGRKEFVLGAAQAGIFVVGTQGGGLAIVEAEAPGLVIEEIDGVDRTRRLSTLAFNETPAAVLPHGEKVSSRIRDAALVLLAADAFGGASRCVELAMDYARVREQFGVPIGQFQGLKHQLVNMAVAVEPARGLYWFAAHAFDHLENEAPAACALAKAHLADRFLQAARDTVEAHGGIGYTWEYDVQIYFKRAMFNHAYLGTPATHRSRYAELVYR